MKIHHLKKTPLILKREVKMYGKATEMQPMFKMTLILHPHMMNR